MLFFDALNCRGCELFPIGTIGKVGDRMYLGKARGVSRGAVCGRNELFWGKKKGFGKTIPKRGGLRKAHSSNDEFVYQGKGGKRFFCSYRNDCLFVIAPEKLGVFLTVG